jgi:hypothetical protein
MDEDIDVSSCAWAWVVQQPRALRFETLDRGGEIRNFEGDVMETFATLVDEFCDCGIGFRGFQQLDARFAGGEHGDVHFFLVYCLALGDRESELLFVELEGGV